MMLFSHFVVRLVAVSCPQVQTDIVSQIKAMGSYKVSILHRDALGWPSESTANLTSVPF